MTARAVVQGDARAHLPVAAPCQGVTVHSRWMCVVRRVPKLAGHADSTSTWGSHGRVDIIIIKALNYVALVGSSDTC